MTQWTIHARDNSGHTQTRTVTAATKTDAIRKGLEACKRNAHGDITNWSVTLKHQ